MQEYIEFFAECWNRMHSAYFLTEVLPYWLGFLMGCIFAIQFYRRYEFEQYERERLARTAERMRRIHQ